ncbi:TolC family protein [Vibrio ponticus]|nr:TolC family protein [Vibrio ponticus]
MRYLNAIILALLVAFPIHAQSLKDIYSLAKQNDLVIKPQETQSKLAELNISLARASLLPQVDASASYNQSYDRQEVQELGGFGQILQTTSYQKSTSKGIGLNVGLSMPIYNHAQWLNLDIAEKQAVQALLAYSAAEQQLTQRVINQYLMVTKAQDLYELLDDQSHKLKLLMDRVSDSNSKAYLDLMGRYTEISAQKVSQRAAWQANLAQLSILTGEVHQSIQPLDTSQIYSSEMDLSLEQAQLLAQQENREYIARKMLVDIAKEQIEIATAAHLPSISGGIFWSHAQDLDSELSNIGVFGNVGVSLPIYTGGAISTSVEIAKQGYIGASDQLALAFRQLISETTIVYDAVNANAGVIPVYKDSVDIAKRAFEATLSAVKTGSRNSTDVVNKLDIYYQNQAQLLSSQYDYLTASITLRLLMGSLSEQDVLDIDSSLR